jgi:hypothetical protein
MILRKHSGSYVKCWNGSIRSSLWSFDPPWALSLWVSWDWNSVIASSILTMEDQELFSTESSISHHWNLNI